MRIHSIDQLSLCIGLISFVMTWPVEVLLAQVTAISVVGGCDEFTALEV